MAGAVVVVVAGAATAVVGTTLVPAPAPPGTLENATTFTVPTTWSSPFGAPLVPLDSPSCWRVRSTDVVAKSRPPTTGRSFSFTATWRWTRYRKSSTSKKRPVTRTSNFVPRIEP